MPRPSLKMKTEAARNLNNENSSDALKRMSACVLSVSKKRKRKKKK